MNLVDKNLYYIGGVVRDEILGIPSFDTDFTYIGNAIDFAKTIEHAKILKINEPFATVKIDYFGNEIDIASTRNEAYPKKGHLPLVYDIGCSLKDDVSRRDFTINAMAKSTYTGEIIDYFNGLEDIKNKKIRVLHDNSFIDDPTRILRALKFRTRFGFELEPHTLKLQQNYLNNINYDISYKRLKKELVETFNLNSQSAFKKFIDEKIYKLVSKNEFRVENVNLENLINKYKPSNIWIIYVGLLPDIFCLPLTKIEKKIVDDFNNLKYKNFDSDYEIYKSFSSVKLESVIMFSVVNEDAVKRYLDHLQYIKIDITGDDLLKLGVKSGPDFQKYFDIVLKEKIKNPKLSKTDQINIVKKCFVPGK